MSVRGRTIFFCVAISASLLLAVSIILPLMNRFRRNMNRENDAMNLHQIGLGILLYCNDHHGDFPDSLATLVATEQLRPTTLVDPDSGDTPASGTPAEIAAQLATPGHQTYLYLGAGMNDKTVDAMTIVAYEPLTLHENGSNVLFGDGHAEWWTADQLRSRMAHSATTRAGDAATPTAR